MEKRQEIEEILNALSACDFEDFRSYTFRNDVVSDFRDHYKKPFDWDEGATKAVLIFHSLGFVIKLPYKGDYYSDGELESFIGANSKSGWDYCEAEEYYGKKADEYGVGECFAKTTFLETINGHPVYYQEIVDSFSSTGSSSHHTYEERDQMEDRVSSFYNSDIDLDWLCDVFDYYGEETFYQFMGFIENFEINDLHNGNIGYIGMRPVILDYSCWHD